MWWMEFLCTFVRCVSCTTTVLYGVEEGDDGFTDMWRWRIECLVTTMINVI